MTGSTRLNKYIPPVLIISFLVVSGCLENSSYQENTLNITTEKTVFHSNETLKVHVYFNSTKEMKAQIQVSGIKNAYGRAMLTETRETILKRGDNGFDFEFTTPSCGECSAVSPGAHYFNATISIGKETYESSREIILAREEKDVSTVQIDNASTEFTGTENIHIDANKLNTTVTIEYFYDSGCPKCAKAWPVIEKVVNSYAGSVIFTKYNATREGFELAIKYQISGVPSIIINRNKNNSISYKDYDGDTAKLESILRDSIESSFTSSNASALSVSNEGFLEDVEGRLRASVDRGFTWEDALYLIPLIIIAGIVVGFNPCLLAILAFIASVTLATTGRRRNVLLIVLMFSLGIFLAYLISGIFFLKIIEYSPSLENTAKNFSVILVSFLGLWHVYDAYHLRKNTESSFHTPKAFIRLTESVTKKVSLPAAFVIGALFSLIKAGCLVGVYLVILNMIKSGDSTGIVYLAAFNLGIVLPVIILGAAIAFGLNPEKVETFRKEKRSAMRLITGVTLLIIAYLMQIGILWQ